MYGTVVGSQVEEREAVSQRGKHLHPRPRNEGKWNEGEEIRHLGGKLEGNGFWEKD